MVCPLRSVCHTASHTLHAAILQAGTSAIPTKAKGMLLSFCFKLPFADQVTLVLTPVLVQQELETVQSQVEAVKQKVADASARCRAARGLRNTLSSRVTAANNALVAVLQGQSDAPVTAGPPASNPQPPVTDAAPLASATPGAPAVGESQSLLPQRAARSYFFSQERPLPAFSHSAVLSPEECERLGCMLPGADGCINLRDSVQAYKSAVAQQVSVPCDDICWFLQTPYVMHTGRQLSFSSSLSSDQCCASFFLLFMATSLENTLAGAELDRFQGALEHGAPPPAHYRLLQHLPQFVACLSASALVPGAGNSFRIWQIHKRCCVILPWCVQTRRR